MQQFTVIVLQNTNMHNVNVSREKDALWQKTDALEFEQKRRDEETERDVNYCLGCHSQFSFWLRKHTCRLDGLRFHPFGNCPCPYQP